MRTIELTKAQVEAVISRLAEVHDTSGSFNIDVEAEDMVITAEGTVTVGGYVEDDYYHGTGAYVETYRDASVTLTGWQYNPIIGEDEEVAIGEESVNRIEDWLNAA